MTLLVCWLVFPVVLALLALGCGLLVERAAGTALPGALLAPAGLALIVVAADFLTLIEGTADLALPAVIVLAAAGLCLSPRWAAFSPRRWRRAADGWALACVVAVFCAFGAPILLSGDVTIAGYVKIEDTAIWLTLVDHVMEHGRSLASLAPSSYEAILDQTLGEGYPVGAFLPLGVARPLVDQDAAWLLQPYMAFVAAMMGLALYSLAGALLESRLLRALVAFVASQPALLFAYSLWGGTKELVAAWGLALGAALLPGVLGEAAVPARALIPIPLTAAALLASLSGAGAFWLAGLLVPGLILLVLSAGPGRALRLAAAFVVLATAFSVSSLVELVSFLDVGRETLTSQSVLGNLIEPLSWRQLFGVWPTGDFRLEPESAPLTSILIVVVATGAAGGLGWAWRRRGFGLLLYVVGAVAGCLLLAVPGAPWVDAKALATASPALLLAALVGAGALFERGLRAPAGLIAAAVVAGVLWSNALAYREVDLAPRDRFAELEQIGRLIDGKGPTLVTEYEFYGVRHFLRKADPEGAAIVHRRQIPLLAGGELQEEAYADIDDFQLPGILQYPTLVLRRSPLASRPPSHYALLWSGRFYEVWQRPTVGSPPGRQHFRLGDASQPGAIPRCGDILSLARRGSDARIAAVVRPRPIVVELGRTGFSPEEWEQTEEGPISLAPRGDAKLEAAVRIPEAGRYGVWIGGSFRSRLEIALDGQRLGERRHELNYSPGQFTQMGVAELGAGTHQVSLRYSGRDLHPGSAGNAVAPFGRRVNRSFALGPLVLSRATANVPITHLEPRQARSLCGKYVDWIELGERPLPTP